MDSAALAVVQRTAGLVRERLAGEASGHDWWHVVRVRDLAVRIAEEEGADRLTVEVAALLHDIADYKFSGDEQAGARIAIDWLTRQKVAPGVVEAVAEIIAKMSFRGAGVADPALTLEGCCVRDADPLDALGAIGIARAFAYGGHTDRPLHDPRVPPRRHDSVGAYRNDRGTTVNHFYEKLLLLRDRMNTAAGRRIAEHRHQMMVDFLSEFHAEWDARDAAAT